MSNYCTCHIDRDDCFWCDYQTVKKSLETYKKVNKRYREALEYYRDNPMPIEGGKVARQALEDESNE